MLKVLEGAAAYVFASPGCKKWDTAAPQAILEAAGRLSAYTRCFILSLKSFSVWLM